MGAAEAITILLALLDRAQSWAAVIGKAQAEGRDVTQAEIDAAVADYDASRAGLVDAIARRKASP